MRKTLITCFIVSILLLSRYCFSGDERYYAQSEDKYDSIWVEHPNGEKELLFDKIDQPASDVADIRPVSILADRIVESLDGDKLYFLIRAWETSRVLIELDIKSKQGRFLRDAMEFRLITKGEHRGKLAIRTHDYPTLGWTGAVDHWWVYDPEKNERIELFSSAYDFEEWEEWEDYAEREFGLK